MAPVKIGVMDPSVKMKSFSYTKFFSWLKWSCLLCGLQFPCMEFMGRRAWWVHSNCPFQFSSVQSLSRVQLFATPWTAAYQAFLLSITNSRSLLKPVSNELVTPSNHLILCHPLLLPPSIFPSIIDLNIFHFSHYNLNLLEKYLGLRVLAEGAFWFS